MHKKYEQLSFHLGGEKASPVSGEGGAVWTQVKGVSETVIVPIAALLLLIVLINELVQLMVSGNQFENAGIGAFIKWSIKFCVGVVLVGSIFDITSWIFQIGVYAGEKGLNALGGSVAIAPLSIVVDGAKTDTGVLLIILIISLFTFLGVGVMLIAVIVTLAGRMIEIFMYFAIAPIPIATMMNSEWRSTGNGWLKGVFAVAFQAFFVVIEIGIFSTLFTSVVTGVNSNAGTVGFDTVLQMLILLAYTIALIMTILRTGSISKTMFGAS